MKTIEIYLEELFKKLPISKTNKEARDNFLIFLQKIYQTKLEEKKEEHLIISEIISEYGTYDQIEKILQITLDRDFEKLSRGYLKKNLIFTNFLSYLLGINASILALILLNIISFQHILITFIFIVTLLLTFIYFYRTLLKVEIIEAAYSLEDTQYLKLKRGRAQVYFVSAVGVSCILLLISFVPLILTLIIKKGFSNAFFTDLRMFFSIALFLIIKTYVKLNHLNNLLDFERFEVKKEIKKIVLYSIIYFSLVLAVSYVLRVIGLMDFFQVFLIFSGVLYVLAFIYYNAKYLKNNGHKIFTKRQKIFLSICLVALIFFGFLSNGSWYLQPYINTIAKVETSDLEIELKYNPSDYTTGIYEIKKPNSQEFKILQLTDIHIGGSVFTQFRDKMALEAVFALINSTKPDLVIITGDFTYSIGIQSLNLNNYLPLMQFASFMRNIGVPWAFTYGNHDSEVLSTHSAEELNNMLSAFSFQDRNLNLLYTDIQPDIYGRNNQIIKILNEDNSVNQMLLLFDSNAYIGKSLFDYDYIHDDQVEWYESELKRAMKAENSEISSMLFFHIPLQEFKEAYDLYKIGSPEIQYFYGKIGEKNEGIACSDKPSKLFNSAVSLKSTKAIFVGHDHYNDLSVEYKGIRLTFGKSIDYLAYPGIKNSTYQRGGTMITLYPDSSFDIQPILLTDLVKN